MDKPFTNYGGYIWPNILACAVYLLSLGCTQLFFTDNYHPRQRLLTPTNFLCSVRDTFVLTWKEKFFFVFLLNLLGWYLFVVSLSDFLIARFHLTDGEMGIYNSYFSICFTLGGIFGTAFILHRWKAKNILFWSLLVGSFGLFLLFGADRVIELWTYLAIPTFTEAWIYPAYQTVLSDQTSKTNQGKLFGLIGATNGACQFVAALLLGGLPSQFSILIAALLFLLSAVLFPALSRKKDFLRQFLTRAH